MHPQSASSFCQGVRRVGGERKCAHLELGFAHRRSTVAPTDASTAAQRVSSSCRSQRTLSCFSPFTAPGSLRSSRSHRDTPPAVRPCQSPRLVVAELPCSPVLPGQPAHSHFVPDRPPPPPSPFAMINAFHWLGTFLFLSAMALLIVASVRSRRRSLCRVARLSLTSSRLVSFTGQ